MNLSLKRNRFLTFFMVMTILFSSCGLQVHANTFAASVSSGKGTKANPYIVKISKTLAKSNFKRAVNTALSLAETDTKNYYKFIIPKGTYQCTNPLKIYSHSTVVATGVKIYAAKGQTLLRTGITKNYATGYNGYKDITIIGGTWDGNSVALAKKGKYTKHVLGRFAHCTNLTFKNATFTHENGNHTIEMAACKNVLFKNCTISNSRVFKDETQAEAIQLDICDDHFGFYNGNGIHYSCENVEITKCVFSGVGEAVGSHSYDKKHPYKNINIHHNTFKNFTKAKRTGIFGYAAIRPHYWHNSRICNNTINKPYIGISIHSTPKSKKIKISGNTIKNPKYAGIGVVGKKGSVSIGKNKITGTKKKRIVYKG